jgi:hypothetical protein
MFGLTKRIPYLKSHKKLRRFSYMTLVGVFLFAIITATYIIYRNEIDDIKYAISTPTPATFHYININAKLSSIDPLLSTYRVTLQLSPVITLNDTNKLQLFEENNGEIRLKNAITLFVQDIKRTYPAKERLGICKCE